MKNKKRIELILAASLSVFGIIMITAAFCAPPLGVIDPTVLAAYGETLTFAGSLIGIDYHYRFKNVSQTDQEQARG